MFLSPEEVKMLRSLNKSWALALLPRFVSYLDVESRYIRLLLKSDHIDPVLFDYAMPHNEMVQPIMDAITPEISGQNGYTWSQRHSIWRGCRSYGPGAGADPSPAILFGLTTEKLRERLLRHPFKYVKNYAYPRLESLFYASTAAEPSKENELAHYAMFKVIRRRPDWDQAPEYTLREYGFFRSDGNDPVFQIPLYEYTNGTASVLSCEALLSALQGYLPRKLLFGFLELDRFKVLVDTKAHVVYRWSCDEKGSFAVERVDILQWVKTNEPRSPKSEWRPRPLSPATT